MNTKRLGSPVMVGGTLAGYLCASKLERYELEWLGEHNGEVSNFGSSPNCICGAALSDPELSGRGGSIVCDSCGAAHAIKAPLKVKACGGKVVAA